MQLPPRYMPGQDWPLWKSLLMVGLPALVALILGLLLFWRLRVPLRELQHQVLQFKDDPQARVQPSLSNRRDEFGDVARSFNHMAEQVSAMLATQRQLLNDMSHELRTPLSRLAVALEGDLDEARLRQRVARELVQMRTLVNDTLTLGWQDTESVDGGQEPIPLQALWDVVSDNAAFESGWLQSRFPATFLPMRRSVAISMRWLRCWKIWCAMRCAILRRRGGFPCRGPERGSGGICGSLIRDPVCLRIGWRTSSHLSSVWIVPGPATVVSGWG